MSAMEKNGTRNKRCNWHLHHDAIWQMAFGGSSAPVFQCLVAWHKLFGFRVKADNGSGSAYECSCRELRKPTSRPINTAGYMIPVTPSMMARARACGPQGTMSPYPTVVRVTKLKKMYSLGLM